MIDEKFIAMDVYIFGVLAISGLFVAGLAYGSGWVVISAIVAAGLAYLAQYAEAVGIVAQIGTLNRMASVLTISSVVSAVIGFFNLIEKVTF